MTRRELTAWLVVFCGPTSLLAEDVALEAFQARRDALSGAVAYEELEPDLQPALSVVFRDLFLGHPAQDPAVAPPALLRAGLEAERRDGIWAVGDSTGTGRGQGIFLVRPGASRPWLLSAPHAAGDDLLTGEIALAWFTRTGAAGGAWAVARRREGDLARETTSAFHAFHLGFAAAHPEGLVVQLHGFAREKRRTEAARRSQAILSSGTSPSPEWLHAVAACMERELGVRVSVYPEEVSELGGTTNAQARELSAAGARFLHLEASLELRRRLLDEPETADGVAACWEAAW